MLVLMFRCSYLRTGNRIMNQISCTLKNMNRLLWIFGMMGIKAAIAQPAGIPELRIKLNESGSLFLKSNITAQVWLRYTENNPGTTINSIPESVTGDIGIRRARIQFFGQIHPRVFIYSQAGINNFGYNTARKPGLFFHDLLCEYQLAHRTLNLGAGLTGWTGFLRYSSPGVASILTYDAPLYQQATNDINDQFLRKLSLYVKGKLGKLDYRLVASKPMLIDTTITPVKRINGFSDFSYAPPRVQLSGYLMLQLKDEESNLIPYTTGTWLGKKRVLNIGGGFQYQPDAMWHYGQVALKDTIHEDMLHFGADVFYDHPLGMHGAALTLYGAWSHTGYGKEYIRSNGAMNPAISGGTSFSGGGNAFPMLGTGNTFYAQAGYLLPETWMPASFGQLQPNADIMISSFERLMDRSVVYDLGINLLLDGHRAKISLNYQNRPVFDPVLLTESGRKSMAIMQLQFAL